MMKLCNRLVALCALTGAAAFMPKAPRAFNTVLHSSTGGPDTRVSGDRVSQRVGTSSPGGSVRRSPADDRVRRDSDPERAWESLSPITVQGGSLRTWSCSTPSVERVQVLLKTEGRPLNANVELWQGPDNTPQKMGVYLEDGSVRPFSCVIETPRGPNAIAIRNTGYLEFPMSAAVLEEDGRYGNELGEVTRRLAMVRDARLIQGGAIHTTPFEPNVQSVAVLLKTDGRPLTARIELLQGPNNNRQVMEIYSEDGRERPFFAVIETPGSGNVVRIVNTATMEFPLTASVEPYMVDSSNYEYFEGSRGWDSGAMDSFISGR